MARRRLAALGIEPGVGFGLLLAPAVFELRMSPKAIAGSAGHRPDEIVVFHETTV